MLCDILKRVGLEKPDGRPIYAYSISDDEYDALRKDLQKKKARHHSDWGRHAAAEFCMFVAEWWRRFYSGGKWSWEGPTAEIGIETWATTNYYPLVRQGLECLRRDLIELNSGRQFLGTLATEGGLPMQLAIREGNSLVRAFRAMFDDIRIFGAPQLNPQELGQQQMSRLPQVFQQAETIPLLLGQVALVVWDYAHLVEGTEDPLRELAEKHRSWQNDLPLKVLENQAKALFSEVLGEARQARSEGPEQLRVVRRLSKVEGNWTLVAEIEAPSRILAKQLARLLGVEEGELPYALKLKAHCHGEERLFALASCTQETYRIESTINAPVFTDSSAAGTIRLVAYVGENEFGEKRPLIGEPLGSQPWIFSPESDVRPLSLFSTGSVRSRRDHVLVAVDEECTVETDENGAIEPVFELGDRKLVRVLGHASFVEDDGTLWRIRCNQDSNRYLEARIRGIRWGLKHARGLPIYAMKPDVWVDREILGPRDILWVSHHKNWVLTNAPPGDGRLRVLDDEGGVVMQQRICRLPDDATIEVCPAQRGQSGFLRLFGFGEIEVGSPTEGISIEVDASGQNQIEVHFEYNGARAPSMVNLFIRWESQSETLLKVPYPREVARFVAGERILPDHGDWIAHSLGMLQAEVAPHKHLLSDPVVIGHLLAEDTAPEMREATHFEISLKPEYIGSRLSGRHTLSLGRIREHVDHALAGTMDLEARVELKLQWPGAFTSQQRTLNLYRYEGRIERSGANVFIPDFRDTPPASWGNMRIVAFRFQDTSVVHELQPTTDGEWLARVDAWQPGTWCVVGIRDGRLSHRPHIFVVDGDYDRTAWTQICEIPDRGRRRAAFYELYKHIAGDADHDAWNALASIFDLAAELPATTFDALDCLTMVPEACATAFLKAGINRIERWWSELEELPFAWHLISIADWRRAIEAIRTSVETHSSGLDFEIPAENYLGHAIDHVRKNLGGESPLFAYMDERLGLGIGLPAEELRFARTNDRMLGAVILPGAFQDLLSRRNPDHYHWPIWEVPKQISLQQYFAEIRLHQPERWRRPMADAPMAAAVACALGIRLSRPDIIYLRRLRNFDRSWFDFAYRVSLARIIAKAPDDVLLGTTPQAAPVS